MITSRKGMVVTVHEIAQIIDIINNWSSVPSTKMTYQIYIKNTYRFDIKILEIPSLNY